MQPSTTALVLIEYQNDSTTPGGTLHAAVAPVMDATGRLAARADDVRARLRRDHL